MDTVLLGGRGGGEERKGEEGREGGRGGDGRRGKGRRVELRRGGKEKGKRLKRVK